MMTMEDFVLIIDEEFSDFRDNYYPSLLKTKIKKNDFKQLSEFRWALNELIEYVSDSITYHSKQYPITAFIDAVVGFEYEMDVFSKVNDQWRTMFENARNITEEVEDILNAML